MLNKNDLKLIKEAVKEVVGLSLEEQLKPIKEDILSIKRDIAFLTKVF